MKMFEKKEIHCSELKSYVHVRQFTNNFCTGYIISWMQKMYCFLTGSTDLSDKLDIIRIEVNPSEKYKSVSLTKTLNLKGQG